MTRSTLLVLTWKPAWRSFWAMTSTRGVEVEEKVPDDLLLELVGALPIS